MAKIRIEKTHERKYEISISRATPQFVRITIAISTII